MKDRQWLVKVFTLRITGRKKMEQQIFYTEKEAIKYAKRREKGCARAKTFKTYLVEIFPMKKED